jgi:drug/metabolite transporter (DMT)-like permease
MQTDRTEFQVTDPFRATQAARADLRALASIVICSVIWGTTWYAITLQLGTVDPTASVTYRFALASVVLFLFCWWWREPIRLSGPQHMAVFGQGVLTFSIQYSMVYEAEQHIASAVVAVIFAGLAFVNLVLFRVLLGQRANWRAWVGAMLGVVGVAAMFIAELRRSGGGHEVLFGLTIALVAMIFAAAGNLAAWKAQKAGAPVLGSVAWAMAYGAGLVFLFGLATGVEFTFEMTPAYVGSLLYLSIFGSVVAFALYFILARAKGYALASYISALTPPVALLMSVIFENARFGWVAALGVALVLAGQVLLIRAPKGG